MTFWDGFWLAVPGVIATISWFGALDESNIWRDSDLVYAVLFTALFGVELWTVANGYGL